MRNPQEKASFDASGLFLRWDEWFPVFFLRNVGCLRDVELRSYFAAVKLPIRPLQISIEWLLRGGCHCSWEHLSPSISLMAILHFSKSVTTIASSANSGYSDASDSWLNESFAVPARVLPAMASNIQYSFRLARKATMLWSARRLRLLLFIPENNRVIIRTFFLFK